ncbi:hypothetical protein HAV22_14295 [Massilia sp. TW-1]|uniref:Lipoprotein n=1 Tax=Telluria antibiotica TaxID=2717319 RepID=A0ABX0PE65_9BURK|nr:hypothetical protein [Telluria antibiotica]NIA54804.1 hypothetical protein [Telluria antibiotica]
MSLIRPLLLCVLSVIPGASWACRVPPAEQLVNPDVQIAQANDIVLAKVISAAPRFENGGEIDYQFLVVKRLAGHGEQLFSLSGRAPGRSRDTTFDQHQDEAFWRRGGGRVMNDVDCVIHPDFVVGKTYLVFRDRPMTWRSFEEIDTVDDRSPDHDKWFAYVQAHVRRDRDRDPQR